MQPGIKAKGARLPMNQRGEIGKALFPGCPSRETGGTEGRAYNLVEPSYGKTRAV